MPSLPEDAARRAISYLEAHVTKTVDAMVRA